MAKEYLMEIKPIVNTQAMESFANSFSPLFNKVFKKFEDANAKLGAKTSLPDAIKSFDKIKAQREKYTELMNKTQDFEKYQPLVSGLAEKEGLAEFEIDQLSEMAGGLGKFDKALGAASKGFSGLMGATSGLIGAFEMAWEAAMKIIDSAKEYSNKFITQGSMFVDADVKSIMAKHGVNAVDAQAMSSAMGQMGISSSDFGSMTDGQRKLFDDLVENYRKGIESIDTEKLDRFNEQVQGFQAVWAKFQQDIELSIMKLFAESDALPKLIDTVTKSMEMLVDLLNSPLVKIAFESFIYFIETILEVVNMIGTVLGFGGSKTANYSINTVVNNKGNSGMNTSALATEIALKTRQVNGG